MTFATIFAHRQFGIICIETETKTYAMPTSEVATFIVKHNITELYFDLDLDSTTRAALEKKIDIIRAAATEAQV